MSVPPRGEIKALTSLRGLAALLVFLFHFAKDAPGLLGVAAHEGHVGVTIFFVLSGFLITGRYFDEFATGRASWRDYLWRRVARIVPLYMTVLVLAGMAGGFDLLSLRRIPEWTLTQAFFSTSLHDLVIPTSWSLTLEECFYLTAPLTFLAIARLRGRMGTAGAALVVLGAVTAVLWGAGLAIVAQISDGWRETFGFIGNTREMAQHTFFGRFVEFALGSAAGLAWRSGRFEGRGALASAVGLAAMAAIVACEWAMARAGDVAGRGWEHAWPWNLPIAAAAAVLVLALADRSAPLGRVLSVAPLPYLGRISYALYLIQLTPLGKDLLYSLLPADQPLYVVSLYVGMSVVAAVLFEVVEEPARRLVLRVTLRADTPAAPDRPSRMRLAAAGLTALLLVHAAAIVAGRLSVHHGPIGLGEVQGEGRLLSATTAETAEPDGSGHRVGLPRRWMEGPSVERRSPTWMLVWADATPVPFVAIEEAVRRAAGGERVASWKRPRVHVVAVHGEVRHVVHVAPLDSALWLRVQLARLARSPGLAVATAIAAGGLAAAGVMMARRSSRTLLYALRAVAGLTLADLVLDLRLVGYDHPLVVTAATALVLAVVLSREARGAS